MSSFVLLVVLSGVLSVAGGAISKFHRGRILSLVIARRCCLGIAGGFALDTFRFVEAEVPGTASGLLPPLPVWFRD